MEDRIKYSTGAKWEDIVGYSRAIKIGDRILVSGTTAIVDGEVTGIDDYYIQTKTILTKIEKVLKEAGATMEEVVRTRIYVKDISKWEEVGKAHGEFFKEIKPVSTMVGNISFVDLKMLVEIEAEAIIRKS
ncbi:MAG: RidA family protein [Ignavibacteria bacterium]|nr:RidA family protein [Ignavibacteria bacterium]